MPTAYRICGMNQLNPGDVRGFSVATADGAVSVIVVHAGEKLIAYRNSCPHTGVNLDWNPGQFLDSTGNYIQCSTHGALFRPGDGYCVHGPCARASLTAVPLCVRDGSIELICD